MENLTLVRHGQANSASKDEHEYDRLSPLGFEQAGWLGDHMRATGQHFDLVYTGTLRRHIETADAMKASQFSEIRRDARLNEFTYFDLTREYEALTGTTMPSDSEGFASHMPRVFAAWQNGDIKGNESFQAFEERVQSVRDDLIATGARVLAVTSGGVIGMTMRQVLGLDLTRYAHCALAIMNSSTHRFIQVDGQTAVAQFNNIAHLEEIGRHHGQTHI